MFLVSSVPAGGRVSACSNTAANLELELNAFASWLHLLLLQLESSLPRYYIETDLEKKRDKCIL